ncbi:MAG: ornithine carbamoyltransferase [Acidobacteria bacterium]|nr:ornithine carbamoyltransferase [Acidobacteriota bacterium]
MALALVPDQISRVRATDFTQDLDLLDDEVWRLLDCAAGIKQAPGRYAQALSGKSVALLFEKPSLRTRMTFELAIKQMGGQTVFSEGRIGAREPIKDVARNLERWVHAIVARTFSQATIDELALWSSAPVINALSDLYHPCQALSDVFTISEVFGDLHGKKLAFVGDGNNVAHSLMLTAARLGMDFAIAGPSGYQPDAEIVARATRIAAAAGSALTVTTDPAEVVRGAHAVYTDVWASMGQEAEADQRRSVFSSYQVNETLFDLARPDAIFLHCLPAKRGEEVTDAIMEHPRSRVFDQAENRLHAQKALLLEVLGARC